MALQRICLGNNILNTAADNEPFGQVFNKKAAVKTAAGTIDRVIQ